MEALNNTVEELIKIKITIFVASTPIRENILRLGELKTKIQFLRGISTIEGKVNNFGDDDIEYTVIYDKVWTREEIEKCETEIDSLQEELDQFNHLTIIEI